MALGINDITPAQTASGQGIFSKKTLADYLLAEVIGRNDDGSVLDANKFYSPDTILAAANKSIADGMSTEAAQKAAQSMMKQGKQLQPFYNGTNLDDVKLGDWSKLGMAAVAKHPGKALALGGLGAGNIGGLTDNNKFGGQLGGLALGGLGASALASGNPYAALMLTLGGGELGALFDKLRAQKEQEQAQMNQYYGRK